MSKHIGFEYGVAITLTALPPSKVMPKLSEKDFENPDIEEVFYNSLRTVSSLDRYNKFRKKGWTTELAFETRDVLLPEIIKAISLCWLSSLPKKGRK